MSLCVFMCMLLRVSMHWCVHMCACALRGDRATIPGVIPQSLILFPFKALILLLLLMYLCVQILCVLCALQVAWEARIRGWSLGVGVTGSCKSFSMGTGNPSKVFWRHSIPSSAPTLLFETKSLPAWSSPRRIGWLASDPQGSLCLLSSSKIRKHHRTWCCYGCHFFPSFPDLV